MWRGLLPTVLILVHQMARWQEKKFSLGRWNVLISVVLLSPFPTHHHTHFHRVITIIHRATKPSRLYHSATLFTVVGQLRVHMTGKRGGTISYLCRQNRGGGEKQRPWTWLEPTTYSMGQHILVIWVITRGTTENCRRKHISGTWHILQRFEPETFTSAFCSLLC